MTTKMTALSTLGRTLAPALLLMTAAAAASAQSVPAHGAKASSAAATKPEQAASPRSAPDRAAAYYHLALAAVYEDDALASGRSDEVNQAIDEYKLALKADPGSAQLADDLAGLEFRVGRVQDAQAQARATLKNFPGDIDAHRLLGRMYLRQLGENENATAGASAPGNTLDEAIAEFQTIVALQPKSVDDHMVLGQLYTVKHQPEKAAAEFKAAQAIEPDAENVVLSLARLYAESGNLAQAAKTIETVSAGARTPRMEFTLGALYDQMKQPKDAIAAYQQAEEMAPGDMQIIGALAQALLDGNQLDAALKQYKLLAAANPGDADPLIHLAEIERRQAKYAEALATIRKARQIDPTSLEAGFNEGLLDDILDHLDDAIAVYQQMLDATSHANGAYTDAEKNNRSIFLERLGAVLVEENKTGQAVAVYQKLINLGGSNAVRGYQQEVDAYRSALEFDRSYATAQQAVAADPKDLDLKLLLAGEMADHGQPDPALALAHGLLDGASADQQRGIWLAIGQMNVRLRRWKDAETAFDKAEPLATKKDDRAYLLFLRGELASQQKHEGQAEQFFNQVLAIDPDNAMTLNYLGYQWADKGEKLPEALQMVRKAVAGDPMNPAFLDSLGWVYFKMGDYDLAEDNLSQAVDRDRTDPTLHMHLGELYEKTGRIRLAAAQWELSLAEFAKSLPADIEPGDIAKVQKKLEGVRVKLAKEDSALGMPKPQ